MPSLFSSFLSSLTNSFVDHPRKVCMNYSSHFFFAMCMARLHAYGVYVSVVHAICPWIYPRAVTDLNIKIAKLIKESGCRSESKKGV